jgi:hypothetical protein
MLLSMNDSPSSGNGKDFQARQPFFFTFMFLGEHFGTQRANTSRKFKSGMISWTVVFAIPVTSAIS